MSILIQFQIHWFSKHPKPKFHTIKQNLIVSFFFSPLHAIWISGCMKSNSQLYLIFDGIFVSLINLGPNWQVFGFLLLKLFVNYGLKKMGESSGLSRENCRAKGGAPGFKVAILGAAGGIGQPLAMLMKMNPLVSVLHLYDVVNTPGVTSDISHMDTGAVVNLFLLFFHLKISTCWF